MTTKKRYALTLYESVMQNKKTSSVWLELRDSIPVRAWLKTDVYPWRAIPYNIGVSAFDVYHEDYLIKWRCWEKEPTPEEMQDTPWEAKHNEH